MQRAEAGATLVGRLGSLPAWEAELIRALRCWMDGPGGRTVLWHQFARCFGTVEGRNQLRLFEGLLGSLCSQGRRPLLSRPLNCLCITSDEAVFLALIREAASGDIAEAALIASLLVPAGQAELIALKAAHLGQALQQLANGLAPTDSHPISEVRRLH